NHTPRLDTSPLSLHDALPISFNQFPKVRWTSAIEVVVAMMVRPHAKTCSLQNATMKNVEAKPQQDVEILRAELFQSDVWKTLNKVLAYGLNLNAVDTRELSRAVHRIERMVGRLLPSVELKVGIVKNVLSKLRINQTPCQLVGKRRGRIRNNRFCG